MRLAHIASTPLSPVLVNIARGLSADIVHLQCPYPPGDLAAPAGPWRALPVIAYQSDMVRQKTLLRIYRPLPEFTLRYATRIIASKPASIASSPFLRRYTARCEVILIGASAVRRKDILPGPFGRRVGVFPHFATDR